MPDTDEIRNQIAALYAFETTPNIEAPLQLQVIGLLSFATSYIKAAGVLQVAPQHWLPILQLSGQSVELALKACVLSSNVHPPNNHDLLKLYDQARSLGFGLDEPSYAAVVHLHHFYYQDLVTLTKFKSRYPAKRSERLGGAVPPHSKFEAVVESLTKQANSRLASMTPNK